MIFSENCETISDKELIEFLVEAKKNTYAAKTNESESTSLCYELLWTCS